MKERDLLKQALQERLPDLEQVREAGIRQMQASTGKKEEAGRFHRYLAFAGACVIIIVCMGVLFSLLRQPIIFSGGAEVSSAVPGNSEEPESSDPSSEVSSEPKEGGLYIPKGGIPNSRGDGPGMFLYEGRLYVGVSMITKNSDELATRLLGDCLGPPEDLTNNGVFTPQNQVNDSDSSPQSAATAGLYEMKGYDPTFRLCVYVDASALNTASNLEFYGHEIENEIQIYEHLDDITLYSGADLFGKPA